MKLRSKLILAFWGLAIVPLAVVTLYSHNSSLRALRSVAEQESSAMASDMSSRMETVSRDINQQIVMFAGFEFRRIMALDKKDRPAALKALEDRLKNQLGENVSFLKSVQFTPVGPPPFPMPPPPVPRKAMQPPRDAFGKIVIDLSGGGFGTDSPENNRKPPHPPFPRGRFDTEIRSGNEVVGKVSAEISSRLLLHSVLRRTQSRQGEIPYAIDAEGKLYTTKSADLQKIKSLPLPKPANKANAQQQVTTSQNWVLVSRKDQYSGLTFGIARPIGDRLGDLRRNAARNMGYGLLVVALAMIGIIPLSSRMTRNLAVLTRETESLAHGDFTARVQVASKDEFGKLARSFNRMAEDLSENQKNLIERERLHKELEMCRKIQEELLPRQRLHSGFVEVKGVSIPAREVGGDFFNYFPMSDENMALLVGDVSGKGLPAALLMANLQATIQARLPLELDLVKLAEQLDSEIMVNNAETYLTLFIAVLDAKSFKLRYVNAGHNPQLLLHSGGSIEQLQSTGRPIGLLAGGGFQEKSVLLKNGDSLFFYTDGLVETMNEAGEEFGMARLESLLVEERARGLEGMLAKVEERVCNFRGKVEAADDATMMLLKIGDAVQA
jgi:serine phosphatase RsbU (regulator of sigma subunit)